MKLTLELKDSITRYVNDISSQIGLGYPPLTIFTDEELKEIEPSAKSRKSLRKSKLGMSWAVGIVLPHRAVVWINVDDSDFLWQILDTVAHECVHLKFPAMEHGIEFQDTVNQVVLGKRF